MDPLTDASLPPSFAHPSEQSFASILDFYNITWRYEPRTFVLARDVEGNPTEGFRPDFYLPDLDLYIELTTRRQRLITKKNRKLRRLRECFPGVNVMMLCRHDWETLADKYNLARS